MERLANFLTKESKMKNLFSFFTKEKDPPEPIIQTVSLTEESARAILFTKSIVLVPGDIITESTPFESATVDTTGYGSMNAIMHVKNISLDPVHFYARGYFGPIGSLTWVEVMAYNRPMAPDEEFVWAYAKAVFGVNFKAQYNVTGAGEVDINNAMMLNNAVIPAT